ncbi:Acetyltransferase (GNAT) family protein [Streptomyces sp. YIM 130001]|uniref:GNAT family N-acetyltransferase n=1 Tax=Streptomyces sp. YIM 130001 TaxID=2259644 RepID=UPI000E64DB7E|nr:GNAT family N-acetyltransferase [Streptomyces sp. YIM 130001]RII19795.1 Acetyltransferase (GNAT) family protein [Streptomyces sp. YIM 130001]
MTEHRERVRISGEGLILREWDDADLPVMSELFDDPDIGYRTPLAVPFDESAARAYLDMIRRKRAEGARLHLAITTDGDAPMGEVLVNFARGAIGYAVGSPYRGQGLAGRATRLLTAYAHDTLGLAKVLLEIEPDNRASVAVARAAGYEELDVPPQKVTEKGRPLVLHVWQHTVTHA